jgi:hypothetical protein
MAFLSLYQSGLSLVYMICFWPLMVIWANLATEIYWPHMEKMATAAAFCRYDGSDDQDLMCLTEYLGTPIGVVSSVFRR